MRGAGRRKNSWGLEQMNALVFSSVLLKKKEKLSYTFVASLRQPPPDFMVCLAVKGRQPGGGSLVLECKYT